MIRGGRGCFFLSGSSSAIKIDPRRSSSPGVPTAESFHYVDIQARLTHDGAEKNISVDVVMCRGSWVRDLAVPTWALSKIVPYSPTTGRTSPLYCWARYMKPVGRAEVQAYAVWTRHIQVINYGDDCEEGTATTEGDTVADFLTASTHGDSSSPPWMLRCDLKMERV